MTGLLFKVLGAHRRPCHGGVGQWPEPGVWTEAREPIPCRSGWHLCRPGNLVSWLGPTIWVAEADGKVVEADDKVVVERARLIRQTPWDDRLERLFAADCAERVLPIFDAARPGDDRPRRAIEAARLYAYGLVTGRELDAARDAARAAAARAAERQWQTEHLLAMIGEAP